MKAPGTSSRGGWPPGWLVWAALVVGLLCYLKAGLLIASGAQVNTNRYHVPLWVDPYPGGTGYVWYADGSNALTSTTNAVTLSNLTLRPYQFTAVAVLTNSWTTSNSAPAPMSVITFSGSCSTNGPDGPWWPTNFPVRVIDATNSSFFVKAWVSNYNAVTDFKKD